MVILGYSGVEGLLSLLAHIQSFAVVTLLTKNNTSVDITQDTIKIRYTTSITQKSISSVHQRRWSQQPTIYRFIRHDCDLKVPKNKNQRTEIFKDPRYSKIQDTQSYLYLPLEHYANGLALIYFSTDFPMVYLNLSNGLFEPFQIVDDDTSITSCHS